MTTIININPNLFIDIEGAYITSSLDTIETKPEIISRNTVPISELKGGKFRRIFNRHRTAFRR